MPYANAYNSAPGPEHFRHQGSLSPEQKGRTFRPDEQDLAHFASQQLNPYSEIAVSKFKPHLNEIIASIALKSVMAVVVEPAGPQRLEFS